MQERIEGLGLGFIFSRFPQVCVPFEMSHNVQYLHFVSPSFAVPSLCSVVPQCPLSVKGLRVFLSVKVCITSLNQESGCLRRETEPTERLFAPCSPFCLCGLSPFERRCHVSSLCVCAVCVECVRVCVSVCESL